MLYLSWVNLNSTPLLFLGWVLWVVGLFQLNCRTCSYKITIICELWVLRKVGMIDLKNISANTFIDIVLTVFCTMDDKIKSGHLGVFLSIIESAILSTIQLLLGKLLLKQDNHRAEVGGLESNQRLTFGEQKAIFPSPYFFFLIPIRIGGEKDKGWQCFVKWQRGTQHEQGDAGSRWATVWVCWFDLEGISKKTIQRMTHCLWE